MLTLPIYQVDAFSATVFGGNPAAVVPLATWLEDDLLQAIASENNLSETAFFVADTDHYHLRWFTPRAEVRLCGHATLAAAHVLFHHLSYAKDTLLFQTLSGTLQVKKMGHNYQMNFPADIPQTFTKPTDLEEAIGCPILETYRGMDDMMLVVADEDTVAQINPDLSAIGRLNARGLIVTAPAKQVDFVSRCFFPRHGIPEDPTTGSAHCLMTPYWTRRLDKKVLHSRQISARVGELICEWRTDRVVLSGAAKTYLTGEIYL